MVVVVVYVSVSMTNLNVLSHKYVDSPSIRAHKQKKKEKKENKNYEKNDKNLIFFYILSIFNYQSANYKI